MAREALDQVEAFLRQVDPVLGQGYSAVVYGSAARGDWEAGRSDINLLLVADALGPAALKGLGGPLAALLPAWGTLPLMLERAEWAEAADAFPIEITDMQLAHATVRGADPLTGLRVDPSGLRAALEREWRTKLLRLRQGYAVRADDPEALGRFASGTLSAVLVLARATLVLVGQQVPADARGVLGRFAAAAGTPEAPLTTLLEQRPHGAWPCSRTQFEGYLAAVASATRFVDLLKPGVSR